MYLAEEFHHSLQCNSYNFYFLNLLVDCTKITGRKELEKVLEEISDTHPDKICSDLKIKSGTCNTIERKDMFTLSRKYMEQNPDPCWEDIIKILCEDFYQLALAKRVLTKYRVPVHVYSLYCQE